MGGPTLSRVRAVDRLRALAALSVMAYHGGFSWIPRRIPRGRRRLRPLIWPLIVFTVLEGLTRVGRKERAAPNVRQRLVRLGVLCGIGSLGSTAWRCILTRAGASLTPAGASLNRAYYGTDTRSQALLAGAGLAVALWATRTAGSAGSGRGYCPSSLAWAAMAGWPRPPIRRWSRRPSRRGSGSSSADRPDQIPVTSKGICDVSPPAVAPGTPTDARRVRPRPRTGGRCAGPPTTRR